MGWTTWAGQTGRSIGPDHPQRALARALLEATGMQAGLGVSLQALYDKINRTEPGLMRVLVQGSAQHLEPLVQPMGIEALLPVWRGRIIDGNHLPASHKRLQPLRLSAQRHWRATAGWPTTRTAAW